MEDDESPQLKSVVIISLPPSNNPSLGKTITAFTFFNPFSQRQLHQHQHQHHHQQQQQQQPQNNDPPIQSYPSNPQLQFSFRRLFHITPLKLFTFFGIFLFALFLYGSLFSTTTILELRGVKNNDGDDEPSSFLLPLFKKHGVLGQRDLKLKLGKIVDVKKRNVIASNSKVVAVDSSSAVFPISGNVYPDGLYYTHLRVGNPPKRYFVDVDTGSDLTWIQCDAPCRSCAKGANAIYKPTLSNIVPSVDSLCLEVQKYEKNGYDENFQQCDYEIQYADHSSSLGVLIKDELHLMTTNGSKTKLNFVFGCGYDQEGMLLNTLAKTDGIMGLSRAKVGLPYQLASKGLIKNVVGHCLGNDGVGGGYMFLGDDFVPSWGMTWVPMAQTTDLYQTEILGINYGNRLLSFDGNSKVGKVVFDSGSSYTYFPKEAYLDLVASLKEVSGLGLIQDDSDTTLPICWQANFPIRSVKDVKDYFKTLTLRFGNKWWILSTLFRIPPEGYLIISNKGNVCLAILDGSNVHDGSSIILGDISLRGHLVVYDNVNKNIGWERTKCGMPSKILKKTHNFLSDSML
ncbi:putative nepenthesin [Medicago truncatula]|uniref:Eukaryotic aspartyl protease family protein n=1 Tax=Medicago truncatula TaxID=3880 RepID=A0A072UBR9_MEDTR|nr:aspartyl protease APCB1 [Medicago truncatula]KEH27052.1 eukaryotic aspartyl protease family protein [Medicago truncatula]RHN52827.1 putative nepenthesin [Medicago truncatula]